MEVVAQNGEDGATQAAVSLRVLGTTRVAVNGVDVSVSRGKAVLLAALALSAEKSISFDQLASMIWDEPPPNSRKAVQNQVRRVRSDFGPAVIITVGNGYRLGDSVLVADRKQLVAVAAASTQMSLPANPDDMIAALGLWRGTPFAELMSTPEVWSVRDRLSTCRLDILDRLAVELDAAGDHDRLTELIRVTDIDLSSRPRLALLAKDTGAVLVRHGISTAARVPALSRGQESLVDAMAGIARSPSQHAKPRALVVAGRAGSGKTTIANALAADFDGQLLVMRSSCTEAPAEAHETISSLIAGLPPSLVLDERVQLVDRLVGALTELNAPSLLIIDDCHWATVALFDLLEQIARKLAHTVVVLVTRDPAALDLALDEYAATHFEAPHLDHSAIEVMLRRIVDGSSGRVDCRPAADQIHALTGGSPLFSAELIHDLDAGDGFVERDGTLQIVANRAVPESLIESVTRQIGLLPLRSRHFLEVVATMHMIGGPSTTVHLSGFDASTTSEVATLALAASEGEMWVMHAEVARAAYGALSEGTRSELHGRAADLLRHKAPLGAARHAIRAPHLPAAIVFEMVSEAADHAFDEADYPAALEMWDRAFEVGNGLGISGEEKIDVAHKRCDAARRAGDDRQIDIMHELIDLVRSLGDTERMAQAVRVICKLGASSDVGAHTDFAAFAEFTLSQDLSPAARAGVLAATTQLYALNNYSMVRDRFDEADAIASELDDGELIRFVLPGAYMSVVGPNDLDRRTEIGHRLLRQGMADNDLNAQWEAHHLLWSCALMSGDAALLKHHRLSCLDLPRTYAEPAKAASFAYMTAAETHLSGDLVGAEREAERCLELSNAVGPKRGLAMYGALLLTIRHDQGRLAEMVPMLEMLHAEQPTIPGWKAGLAWALAETGERDKARDVLAELVADGLENLPRDITHTSVFWACGMAAALTRDRDICVRFHELLMPYEHLMSSTGTCTLGSIDLALGQLAAAVGERDQAKAHFVASSEAGKRNNWPAVQMRAELAYASLSPHLPESQQTLSSVYAHASQLGIEGIAIRARRHRRG